MGSGGPAAVAVHLPFIAVPFPRALPFTHLVSQLTCKAGGPSHLRSTKGSVLATVTPGALTLNGGLLAQKIQCTFLSTTFPF